MSAALALSPQTRVWRSDAPLPLVSGETLPGLQLAYRTWGRLNAAADNAVVVCHALTGNADLDAWWPALLGAGRSIDPERDFVICSNVLGGCGGSSGPLSPAPDGLAWGRRFPAIGIRDQVHAQMRLADALGVRRIRWVIGGSMGGLQALEWGLMDRERVGGIVCIAASASHSAWCLALNEAQRLALRADLRFNDGDYAADAPPRAGLAAARAIAMVSYRAPGSLDERFGRRSSEPGALDARSWLRHHGERFVERFDANSYLALIDAMDRHDVGEGRGGVAAALGEVDVPALVVSIPSDQLYPQAEQFALCEALPKARLVRLASPHGHDGFLIDAPALDGLLLGFRQSHERVRLAYPAARAARPERMA